MILKQGCFSVDVIHLQRKLKEKGLLEKIDGDFGPKTKDAVIKFQQSVGLDTVGHVGPKTHAALNLPKQSDSSELFSTELVKKLFSDAPHKNVMKYLPSVLGALGKTQLSDCDMILITLGTIRAETAGFEPISEFKSKFNTSLGGHPFDKYDFRADLGNRGIGDGDKYKGRGFVQLTGRANYAKFGPLVGADRLVDEPELANDPVIAAALLAHFLKSKENLIRKALEEGDLKSARRGVNGGIHGFEERFEPTMKAGIKLVLDVL